MKAAPAFGGSRFPVPLCVVILISDIIVLKIKKITRGKEGHYIMIMGSFKRKT